MNLFKVKQAEMEAAPSESLDRMWHEAEQLGLIEVDRPIFKSCYRVTIRFERRSGTSVRAVGEDQNIAFAMAKAINEAREMGAGSNQ